MSLEIIMSSHYLQMLAFKKEELDVERGDASAYTDTPTHSIKAVAASARRFLDRTATRTSLLAQHADAALPCSPPYTSASEHNAVLNGLRFELDSYLHEPRAEPFKRVTQDSGSCHIIWCDPLRYWTVCMHPRFSSQFSLVRVGCREEVSLPLSTRDGCPSSASFCGSLRAAVFFEQGDVHPSPEPYQPRSHGGAPNPQVFIPFQ